MDPSPRVSIAKRIIVCALLLLVVGMIGGVAALTATAPKIPHPWGDIRLMNYSTNTTGATMAHFRFQNLFEWPVFLEIGLEVNDGRSWEAARGYSMFVPIEKPVASKAGQKFAVPLPVDVKQWRVLVRAFKADLSKTDVRREKIKQWLESHGAGFLGKEIKIESPDGYVLPGPVMKWDKPGRLPTPYYGTPMPLPASNAFPAQTTGRAGSPRR